MRADVLFLAKTGRNNNITNYNDLCKDNPVTDNLSRIVA